MSSMIYGILAILLIVFLGLNMQRGQLQTQDRMVVNEVATDLSGVAYSILDFIGRTPFDENTDESKVPQPVEYPVITSTSQLTAAASFGGCGSLTLVPEDCDDLDDFHGLTGTRTVGGLDYTFAVTVRYVDPANPNTVVGAPTYAKEVAVVVQNPYLTLNGAPMPVRMTRVHTYNRHVDIP
jgi:hypothetical protein